MITAEFEKQPRGPYLFDWWVGKRRVLTSLGLFAVEFLMGNGDTNPPDNEMLKRASELMVYAQSHGEYLLDIVFGHYLLASEDSDWLESCGVPQRLSRDEVAGFLREDRSLVVSRDLDLSEPYSSSIHVVPLWDEEHALTLDLLNGAIVTANDMEFKLDAGALRWVSS